MSSRPRLVLKFGGSVLRDREALRLAVNEIYRWRREGWSIVAVVSAFAGRTEELLSSAPPTAGPGGEFGLAALAACGEQESAAQLVLELDRRGVPACSLTPSSVELRAEGPALEAVPISLDPSCLEAALERDEVVVVPGFAARDEFGRTVLLGRGGSDLTAIFLAKELRAARCRLIKDVPALFESDPAQAHIQPRRFATASWSDALNLDGTIVQHKAVRFARSAGVEFEVGGLNGVAPTLVGARPAAWLEGCASRQRTRVVLLGLGTVGRGVYAGLQSWKEHFELCGVAVRSRERALARGVPESLLVRNLEEALDLDAEVVIEVIGDTSPAERAIETALCLGRAVVTANKALLARRGASLANLAREHGVRLAHSAAVGGSVPVLERLRSLPPGSLRGVRGVLNGTVNYLLEEVARGETLQTASSHARRAGFAERDASRDLSGKDAADKLCLMAAELGLGELATDDVFVEALTEASIARARQEGPVIRQVASLDFDGGALRASVRIRGVAPDDPLAAVFGEGNACVLQFQNGGSEILRGRGAGELPTAESVLGDLLELERERRDSAKVLLSHSA